MGDKWGVDVLDGWNKICGNKYSDGEINCFECYLFDLLEIEFFEVSIEN